MIPRKFRLSGRKNIDQLKSVGKVIQSGSFGILYSENGVENPRYCIVVSKKISGKATVRNKVKRQLRFILMQLVSKFKKGYDLMLLVKRNVLSKGTISLNEELIDILSKEGII